MTVINIYKREDMLKDMADAAERIGKVGEVMEWVCDCKCGHAQWFQRVKGGMTFISQAWPVNAEPSVLVLESRREVDLFVTHACRVLRGSGDDAIAEARAKAYAKFVWMVWDGKKELAN